MPLVPGTMFFTATDIANFVACRHLLTLKFDAAEEKIQKPYFHDLGVELLRELGERHEAAGVQSHQVDLFTAKPRHVSRHDELRVGRQQLEDAKRTAPIWFRRSVK